MDHLITCEAAGCRRFVPYADAARALTRTQLRAGTARYELQHNGQLWTVYIGANGGPERVLCPEHRAAAGLAA